MTTWAACAMFRRNAHGSERRRQNRSEQIRSEPSTERDSRAGGRIVRLWQIDHSDRSLTHSATHSADGSNAVIVQNRAGWRFA